MGSTRLVTGSVGGDGVAVLTFNHPPVNAWSSLVQQHFQEELSAVLCRRDVSAVVLVGAGSWIAGADIKGFFTSTNLSSHAMHVQMRIHNMMEATTKPIVAAIHRWALGGGLELAMACTWRICTRGSKLGLPELSLGIVPGYGGTQRLPRLVGVSNALRMVLSSRPVSAQDALQMGLIDEVLDELTLLSKERHLLDAARARASALASVPVSERPLPSLYRNTASLFGALPLCEEARLGVIRRAARPSHVLLAGVRCIRAAVEHAREPQKGLLAEVRQLALCMAHPAARALTHFFLAQRAASPRSLVSPVAPPSLLGVVGAGKMGRGIAEALLKCKAGLLVIQDVSEESLESARGYLEHHGLPVDSVRFTRSMQDLSQCDIVIEAATENLALKRGIFSALLGATKPECTLATNTSSIDIDKISDSPRVVGMHFFFPVPSNKLVEIVRSPRVSQEAYSQVVALGKRMRKVPVTVRSGPGFAANRIFAPYLAAALYFIENTPLTPLQVDGALREFGFPAGPFVIYDMIGIDVAVSVGRIIRAGLPGNRGYDDSMLGLLLAAGRGGCLARAGFYRYRPGGSAPDEQLESLLRRARASRSAQEAPQGDQMALLMLCLVADEGLRVLREHIARQASDLDVISILGFGFPAHLGGVMHWAEHIVGWRKVLHVIQQQYSKAPLSLFMPSDELKRVARSSKM